MNSRIREKYLKDGFVVLEEFLRPEECDELVEAGMEFTNDLPEPSERIAFTAAGTKHQRESYFIESNDKIRPFFEDAALDEQGNLKVDPKISLNKVGHALHLLHPLFRCYTYCGRVKSAVQELELRDPAVVQSMLIYKNPGIGSGVPAHQDITYLYSEPIPPVGFWIALEHATIDNGCLWVAPGSHRSGVHRRMIRNPNDLSKDMLLLYNKPPQIYPESCFIPVQVPKGSCIILHGQVVHKSAANRSDKPRPAYTFHIIERLRNKYSPENWLQEGPNAPFQNLYDTKQLM